MLKVRGNAGAAAGARHPPSGRDRGQRPASPNASRWSTKPADCSPTARRPTIRSAARAPTSASSPTRTACAAGRDDRHLGGRPRPRPRADHRRFRLQPHHPDLGQIRSRGRVVRSSQTREEQSATTDNNRRPGFGRQRVARRQAAGRTARQQAATTEPQDRGNRQLRDLAHHQDRGDRGRPHQPHLGRGAGRRHLHARTTRARSVYQPRSKEEIDRIAALVRTAIGFDEKRGDQVEVVNLRFAETPTVADQRADRLDELPAIHQGRHHARRRARRDGAARPRRAAASWCGRWCAASHAGRRRASAGRRRSTPAAPRVRGGRRPSAPAASRSLARRRHDQSPAAAPAASPRPAARTSRSSAATRRSPSPTAPRR